jgi:hypothetical protein
MRFGINLMKNKTLFLRIAPRKSSSFRVPEVCAAKCKSLFLANNDLEKANPYRSAYLGADCGSEPALV